MTKLEKCFSRPCQTPSCMFISKSSFTHCSKAHGKSNKKLQKRLLKKLSEKTAQKGAEKGPRQQKQSPQLEDDDWTIVTYFKSRLKHPHTVPQKRVPEKRDHHIVMKYNQRNKEKTDSNTRSFISLVVNPNTHSRDSPVVLAHPDT
jgi:hypothetical protein